MLSYRKQGGKLMIFRAEMQNSHDKWWFLSLPDREKPFTTKDIDFYQYVPPFRGGNDQKDPPMYGWQLSDRTKTIYMPPPTVVRLSDYIPPGQTEDSFLIYNIKDWVLKHDILNFVFKQSIHREVISRSRRLMQLLAEMHAIDNEMIRMIWNAGYNSQEKDITDEIFGMLGFLFYDLATDVQSVLINEAVKALTSISDENKDMNKSQQQVSLFLEQLITEHVKHRKVSIAISHLSRDTLASLVLLIWSLFESETFINLKNHKKIELLLSTCFKSGMADDGSLLATYIKRCVSTLSSSSSSSISGGATSLITKNTIKQQIRCLSFLFLRLGRNDEVLTTLHGENFAAVLESELSKYISENRPLFLNDSLSSDEYGNEIRIRLSLFHTFYASSPVVEMDEALILRLSEQHISLSIPVERDELFRFFTLLIQSSDGLYTSASNESIFTLFKNVVCNENLEWKHGTQITLETFREYFIYVHKLDDQVVGKKELTELIALPTVWKMTLTIHEVDVRNQAMQFLMTVFSMLEEQMLDNNGRLNDNNNSSSSNGAPLLVKKVFSELRNVLDGCLSTPTPLMSEVNAHYVSRCISILRNGIVQSKVRENSALSFGATGGSEGEVIVIKAKWRRSSPYRSTAYVSAYTSTCNETTEGFINIHVNPYTTIYTLKQLIIAQLDDKLSNASKLALEIDHSYVKGSENEILKKYDVSSSTDVVASYSTVDTYNNYNTSHNYSHNPYGSANSIHKNINDNTIRFDGIEASVADDVYFNTLIGLMDVLSSTNCDNMDVYDGVMYDIWDILMRIPTNQTLFDASADYGGGNSSNNHIFFDMFHKSAGNAIYLLRIISNFLQPLASSSSASASSSASSSSASSSSLSQSDLSSFRNGFLANNGFTLAFEYFLASDCCTGFIQKLGN